MMAPCLSGPLCDVRAVMTIGADAAGNTASTEGWALYAETLYPELKVETDPYQRMGGLNDEMLRAMRLVVDTGLHIKGWSREQAIRYMLDNSPMPDDVTAEVEALHRHSRAGSRLEDSPAHHPARSRKPCTKAEAKAALGAHFDSRAFRAAVLDTGSLPMPVLKHKIADWTAAQARDLR